MTKILSKNVSFYKKITEPPVKEVDLYTLLTSDRFKDSVEKVRQTKAVKGKEAYDQIKKSLPSFTVSGTFSGASDSSLLQHSGLICIDIDRKDNLDMDNFDQLKEIIYQVPHVAYCGHSLSGESYFCVIPISHAEKHRDHFRSLQKDFARCGLTIDTNCINVGRKRFVSYDPEPYINLKAEVYSWIAPASESRPRPAQEKRQEEVDPDTLARVEAIADYCERELIDITEGYDNWLRIGAALASLGEAGRDIFHRLSAMNSGYDYGQADKQFTACLRMDKVHVGTLFHIAREHGVTAAIDFKDITA
ncbi:hypothetical protein M2480_001320 [Parabacteroides sp. PFB2-12]|uniref:BT4734/BF3469 family protein n=1 Tax=unclassified Parabacteroides TaxID=2649774 RepID=UPI0024760CBA|nr:MULTISPECIES: BT4734/BF3469 family protein [unclassified Parabacteroides]MDH6343331.1 hypothetical protein [Parabacteroides sp. PM6-13]MDH6390347.1 hypothetical protein [Parabacteroides sp. PFB2-12]